MSKASKARKKERRFAELQKIQGLQNEVSASVSSEKLVTSPTSSTSQLNNSLETRNSKLETSAEFAHVKFDLVKISIVVLLVVAFYTVITIIDNQTGFLSDLAKSIFRFLQLPV